MLLLVLRRYRPALLTLVLFTSVVTWLLLQRGGRLDSPVEARDSYLQLSPLLTVLPLASVLIGAFWGAPLVSQEVELGTIGFIWTQTVSRRRWFLWYAGLLSVAIVGAATVLGLTIAWWLRQFDGHDLPGVGDDASLMGVRGLALAGWWWLAFGLGTLAGALIRRTVAAMAVSVCALVVLIFLAQTVVVDLLIGPTGLALTPPDAVLVLAAGLAAAAVLTLLASWSVVRRLAV